MAFTIVHIAGKLTMILNIGIDIEKISRFKGKSKSLLARILTGRELKSLKNKNSQTIAGIFCAKEAIIKACSIIEKINFNDIEIFHKKNGMPFVKIKNLKKISSKDLKISISHSKDYAVAAAVLLKVI